MSAFLTSIIDRYYPASGTELHVGRVSVSHIVGAFGAPLYVYDGSLLVERVRAIKDALGPRVDLLFAVKANPSLAIVQLLGREGVGAEIASAGELVAVQRAGIEARNVHFAGPGKTDEDLRYAIDAGIASINVESRAELERIAALSRKLGRPANVSFRIRFEESVAARMRMAGGDQKFGLAPEAVADLLTLITSDGSGPRLVGLHTYAGTQCFDAGSWLDQAQRLLTLANELEAEHDVRVGSLNFGGGFGFGYFDGDPTFDLGRIGAELQRMVRNDPADYRRYLIELGRYVVAPAGTYIARVTYAKVSGSRHHLILDGGLHQHAAAAGIGSVIKRPFPIVNATRLGGQHPTVIYSIGGSLCTPADEFCRDFELPATAQGDYIAVLSSGAYGYTFSQLNFLSHNRPAEILVLGDEMHLIREATTPEDVLVGQHGLPF